MKSVFKSLLAFTILIQSVLTPALASGERVICNSCAERNLHPGDVVNVHGTDYRVDRVGNVNGTPMWLVDRVDSRGGSAPSGSSLRDHDSAGSGGGGADKPGNSRLTGRDFSDYEDSSKYSDKDRAKVAELQALIVDRINKETIADANATIEELKKQSEKINDAGKHGTAVLGQLAAKDITLSDSMGSLLATIQTDTPLYLDEAGWQAYDDHPFKSDHKEELEKLRLRLNTSIPQSPQQADAKSTGYVLLNQADDAYVKTDIVLGDRLINIAKITIDIATDIIPLTAIPKDFYRAFVGKDPRTGETLANWERGLAAGLMVVGMVSLGASNIAAPEIRAIAAASAISRDANAAKYTDALVAEAKSTLTEIRALNPTAENATLKQVRGYKHQAWDQGKSMLAGKTVKEEKFVRFFKDLEFRNGSWLVKYDQVAGKTPGEIKELLALEHVPRQFAEVTVPVRTELSVGYLAPNEWGGIEGSIQYFIEDSRMARFGESKILGEVFK
jgi:hypothetical protein